MNILNIKEEEVMEERSKLPKDNLEALFFLVSKLRKNYEWDGEESINIHSKNGQDKIKKIAYYMIEELMEAMNLLKNRPWTSSEQIVDLNHLDDEISDFILFTITLLQMLGYTPEKLVDIIIRKYKVNLFRIKTNY